MIEKFFTAKNIYYRVNEIIPGRPTLVFLHGLSGSSSAWSKYEEIFKNKYNILSLDLRGHGKSLRPKKYQDYKIKYFTEDLFELINFSQIKDFTLISHSFGTLVALEFLAEHQHLVKSAVFLSPSFNVSNRKAAFAIKPFLNIAKIIEVFPQAKKIGSHINYEPYLNTGDWNLRRTTADIRNTGLRSYVFSMRQIYELNHENLLPRIKIPILIIHGGKDTIFPVENSKIMSKKINNSKLILLKRANHILVFNNFSEVSKAIEDFV